MEPFPCCPVSQLRALKRSLVVNHQSFQSQLSSSKRGVQGTNFPALQTLGFTTCHHSTLLWPLVLAHSSVFSNYLTLKSNWSCLHVILNVFSSSSTLCSKHWFRRMTFVNIFFLLFVLLTVTKISNAASVRCHCWSPPLLHFLIWGLIPMG